MGKKINPLLFRSTLKFKKTNWVSDNSKYSDNIEKDQKARLFIINFLKKKKIYVHFIYIFRKQTKIKQNFSTIYIKIYILNNESKIYITKSELFKLKELLKNKYFYSNSLLNVNLQIENSEYKNLIQTKFNTLIKDIKKGISPKMLFSLFLKDINSIKNILGTKLELKGRINGSEKAKILVSKSGYLHFQKVTSKIVYLNEQINTKDGVLNLNFLYNLK